MSRLNGALCIHSAMAKLLAMAVDIAAADLVGRALENAFEGCTVDRAVDRKAQRTNRSGQRCC